MPVLGFPITDMFIERNHDTGQDLTVQYFERQRFELHPEYCDTPYQVLLGRLGDQILRDHGRDWRDFPSASPTQPHYFAETGHAIAPEFWSYWSSHGIDLGDSGDTFRESLALFGYPLSEPMLETNADGDTVMTQFFERAVFEWRPENTDPWRVLLRRIGAEALNHLGISVALAISPKCPIKTLRKPQMSEFMVVERHTKRSSAMALRSLRTQTMDVRHFRRGDHGSVNSGYITRTSAARCRLMSKSSTERNKS